MLYRIEPPMRVTACSFLKLADVEEYGDTINLDKAFDEPTSARARDVLAIALRRGLAITGGLAVDAWPVMALRRPAELRTLIRQGQEIHRRLKPQTDAIDRMLGMEGATDDVNARADASMEAEAQRADREAQSYLDAAVREDLVEHWRSLGGAVPV